MMLTGVSPLYLLSEVNLL